MLVRNCVNCEFYKDVAFYISFFFKWNIRLGYEGYGVRSIIDRSLQPFTMKTEMKSQLTSMYLVFPNSKYSILSRCYEIKILYCKSVHIYSCTILIFIYLLKYKMCYGENLLSNYINLSQVILIPWDWLTLYPKNIYTSKISHAIRIEPLGWVLK